MPSGRIVLRIGGGWNTLKLDLFPNVGTGRGRTSTTHEAGGATLWEEKGSGRPLASGVPTVPSQILEARQAKTC